MTHNHDTHTAPNLEAEIPIFEYANKPYEELVTEVSNSLASHHDISYIPFAREQALDHAHNISYREVGDLPDIMADTDAIICISRDEEPNQKYSEQHPERNIALTPSGKSNVDRSVELFKLAEQAGNNELKFIATGRMHNRAVRMMFALPVVAEFMGINAEDAYHISEAQFKKLLDTAFTPENIGKLDLDAEDKGLGVHHQALVSIFHDKEYSASIPGSDSTVEELQRAAKAVFQEYKKYPRISTSRLMVERALQQGVPLDAIFEEDGAVDTISNLVFTAEMIDSIDELKNQPVKRVVIVAGSDHLPRTAWIADHIIPDDIEIVCVESDPSLTAEEYTKSCTRELASFRKGSKWISGTRDLEELESIVLAGYFGTERKDADRIAQEVAAAHDAGTLSVQHA